MVNNVTISKEELLALLQTVVDPEIPVLTIAEMGILRNVEVMPNVEGSHQYIITITPTYSGCPATDLICMQIRMKLVESGITNFVIKTVLTPAWTTDNMTEAAMEKLRIFGIAPPVGKSINAELLENVVVHCPRCGSAHTRLVSAFGATACKAFYECKNCLEPFDYFKCH